MIRNVRIVLRHSKRIQSYEGLTVKFIQHSSPAVLPSTSRHSLVTSREVATCKSVRMAEKLNKAELKNRLTPLQYHVTQEKGTERPFTGCYNKVYDSGTYVCIVCEQPLFSSETKYDSGCGWPAFNDVLDQGKIKLTPDTSGGRIRTEVTCNQCGSHLGHVFNDGPLPTRKRFCINSASMDFIPDKKEGADGS